MNETDMTIIVGIGLLVCGFFIGHAVAVGMLTKRFVARLRGQAQHHSMMANALVNSAFIIVKEQMTEREFIMKLSEIAWSEFKVQLSLIPTTKEDKPNVDQNRSAG